MKKIIFFLMGTAFVAFGFTACKDKKESDDTKVKSMSSISPSNTPIDTHGYMIDYSSSFAMGENKNAETILALWKGWDENKLDVAKDYFADSVELHFWDGATMSGPRDSAIAGAKMYRSTYTDVHSQVHAIFPVMSTDKNENWVCIWGTEYHTDKAGKTDSLQLQETWRFNKDGKANLVYQYSAKNSPAK